MMHDEPELLEDNRRPGRSLGCFIFLSLPPGGFNFSDLVILPTHLSTMSANVLAAFLGILIAAM
jgi:hypothetical protein